MSTTTAPGADADPASPARRSTVTAIDSHAHVFSRDLPLAEQRRYAPTYDAPLSLYLAQLDRHGISHGVLVQPSFLGADNRCLLEAIEAAPHRLRGVAVIDPVAAASDPTQLDALARRGIVGVRLNLFRLPNPDFASAAWQATLPRIVALGWHVELHCEAHRLPDVAGPLLARARGAIDIVVDHFGRPDPALGIGDPGFQYLLTLGTTRRVWVKVSAAYRNAGTAREERGEQTALAAIPLLKDSFGLDRLVWGSDWPHTQNEHREDYDTVYAMVSKLLPTKPEQQAVLVDTPAKLFHFA